MLMNALPPHKVTQYKSAGLRLRLVYPPQPPLIKGGLFRLPPLYKGRAGVG